MASTPLPPHGPLRPRWRFAAVGYALVVLLTGTNLPTPLYALYERRFGFSPLVVTVVFAAYVAALVPALLVAGPLSDAIGRRAVLAPALVLAAAGAGLFALATSTPWLFGARIVQGVAVGAASGALTAALVETEPSGDRRRAALVATAASVAGLGLGPLVAGILAQYAPAPLRLSFVVEIAALLPAVAVAATLPERGPRTRWRPRRPEVPSDMRGTFALSGGTNFLAFAVIGLFLALVPTYASRLAHSTNLVLGAGAVAAMIACSLAAQLAARSRPPGGSQRAGLVLLAVGLVLLAIAGALSSLALMAVATAAAGGGQGLIFSAGTAEVTDAAPAARRADVLSSFYVVVYLGVGLPVVGVGLLAGTIGLLHAVECFAVGVAACCLVLAVALCSRTRRRVSLAPKTAPAPAGQPATAAARGCGGGQAPRGGRR